MKAFSEEWSPSVDISETEDKILVKAELPELEAKIEIKGGGDLCLCYPETGSGPERCAPGGTRATGAASYRPDRLAGADTRG